MDGPHERESRPFGGPGWLVSDGNMLSVVTGTLVVDVSIVDNFLIYSNPSYFVGSTTAATLYRRFS